MADLRIEKLSKYFGEFKAIDNANVHINEGEFFTLLGPSGCGKTTLLRTIAGFYQQEKGHLYFGDRCMDRVPAHKRNIGMVFQNYAIFPHLTVFDNVAYGLKARKIKKEEIEKRVMDALEMVELAHLRDRQPAQLSGGQQQRIALARAVVIHPGLLLMDEPLSNLDAKLRVKMRSEIRTLQKRLNITTIYVTHDQEEALAVSDRIAVLDQGKIQQIGQPHEIYLSPQNQFVANFVGTTNFIKSQAKYNTTTNQLEVYVAEEVFMCSAERAYDGKVLYSIRPEQLKLMRNKEDAPSPTVQGTIINVTFLGEKIEYEIELKSGQTVQVNDHAITHSQLRHVGETVYIYLNPIDAVIFDGMGKEVISKHANINDETTTQTV